MTNSLLSTPRWISSLQQRAMRQALRELDQKIFLEESLNPTTEEPITEEQLRALCILYGCKLSLAAPSDTWHVRMNLRLLLGHFHNGARVQLSIEVCQWPRTLSADTWARLLPERVRTIEQFF